ncbi:MAG: Hsp20/alpha crystallin family protein [Planctomycetaceae bacterium]
MSLSLLPRRATSMVSSFFGDGPLGLLRDEIDDLFIRFASDAGNGGVLAAASWPSLDVSETDTEIQIKLDAPGMKPDELDIEITGDLVQISGQHEEQKEESGRKYHRVERRTGSFERAVRLPCTVDEKNVDAQYKEGVLTMTLAKTEEAKAHKIRVKG